MNYVQGEKFMSIADHIYAPSTRHRDDYNGLVNTLDFTQLKDNDIIYTHIFYVQQLFNILKHLKPKVVVVTHNADEEANVAPPENVLKWFSSNVTVDDKRVVSLPLALENNRWFKKIKKLDIMEAVLKQPKTYQNLLYMNFNADNNPKERLPLYQMLEGKSWVTTGRTKNGSGFEGFINNIYNHKYVLCPRGSSMDCHRRWETLHMCSIPVVRKDSNNWAYGHDLPILFVEDWKEVTEELLNDKWEYFTTTTWNMDKLNFDYWKNLILNGR
jgi:hypothetical protein